MLVAVGDPRQGGSIDAEAIGLLTEALGDKVPRILTSVRQRTDREREISRLFSEGGQAAHQAIQMRREDGHAVAVAGGRHETIARVASLWRERVEARGEDPDFRLTISAPTNRDAHDIGVAIRQQARDMGQLGEDKAVVRVAMRGEKELQPLPLAAGDRVRLFNRAIVDRQHFGSNGDTIQIMDANNDGMLARNDEGRTAFVKFDQLRPMRHMPALAYGYALTHDAAQGITSDEHINAMPDGSRAVNSRKAYPAESRNRDTTWTVVNEAAERKQIASRLPYGTRISSADVWRNVGDNLGRDEMRQSATAFLRTGSDIRRGATMALPAASGQVETREQQGRPAPVFHHGQELQQAQRVGWLHQAMERVQQAQRQAHEMVRERVRAMAWERHTPSHEHQHPEQHTQRHGMSLGR
ncbi:MAG: hypothetical protein ACJ8AW_50775 [Rhodopila sp.]